MEIRLPSRQELKLAYERDMKEAFPRSELKPLRAIAGLYEKGLYRPWCLFDGDELVGEAFVWAFEEGYVLFDYLCITASRRNDGLGAQLVAALLEREKDNVIFGEAEIPAYAPDAQMAQRRLGFYERCGLKKAFYDTALFGVPYHTLYRSLRVVDENELLAAHRRCYRGRFAPFLYKKFIMIPWDSSMGIPKKIPWEE